MSTKFSLPSGCSARGAQMGRANRLPGIRNSRLSLHLLPMDADGCYDKWGAYWGIGTPLYVAHGDGCLFFTRAHSRNEAKTGILEILPHATFKR